MPSEIIVFVWKSDFKHFFVSIKFRYRLHNLLIATLGFVSALFQQRTDINLFVYYKTGWSSSDLAKAGVAGAVCVVAAPAALTVVGFTSAGVAAGSVAAAAQSTFYGGYTASGSLFAAAQSAGAAWIGAKAAAGIFTTAGGATLFATKEED